MAGFTFPSNWYKISTWCYRHRHWDSQLLHWFPIAGWERFQHPIPVLKSQESHQTPDSENSSKQKLCYFYKMCTEYTSVNNLQGFSSGGIWHGQHFWMWRQFYWRNLYCLCQQKWWVPLHTCLWTACSGSRGVNWLFQLTRLVLRSQNQLRLLEVPETFTELLFLEKQVEKVSMYRCKPLILRSAGTLGMDLRRVIRKCADSEGLVRRCQNQESSTKAEDADS